MPVEVPTPFEMINIETSLVAVSMIINLYKVSHAQLFPDYYQRDLKALIEASALWSYPIIDNCKCQRTIVPVIPE